MKDVTIQEIQSSTFTELNVRQDKGEPYFIRLHDSVVKNLERRLASGEEKPGLLIGSFEAANLTISVEDFEPAANIEERIRTWTPRAGSRQHVVGCYRSYTRPEFALDPEGRALFQRCFPRDARLLLEVKPPKADVGTAMFFLGENGKLSADRATVEFPFNLRELGAEEPADAVPDAPAKPAAAAPAKPVPAAPKPVVSATPKPAVVETAKPVLAVNAKPTPVPAPQPAPVAAKPRGGMIWTLVVGAAALIATVVGLNGLHIFDNQSAPPQHTQPVAQQSAPVEPQANVKPPVAPPEPSKPAPAKTIATTPVPRAAPAPPVKTAQAPAPAPPVRVPQTVVADNTIARQPDPPQPVTQAPAPPPVPQTQPRIVATAAPASPPPSDRPATNLRPSAPLPVAPANPPVLVAAPVQTAAPVTPPRAIRQTAPVVQDSVRRSITGETIIKVRANIDASGKVVAAESVSKGSPIAESLAGSAIAAVKRWEFEPARRGSENIAGDVVLTFTFRK